MILPVSSRLCLLSANATSTFGGPEPWKIGLGVLCGVFFLAAAAFGGLYLWKVFRPRRGGSAAVTASYAAVPDHIKVELQ